MCRFSILIFILLVLNSAYLAAFAEPSVFYMSNVILHLVLGFVFAILFLKSRFRRPSFASILLTVGLLLGFTLIFTGAYRPYRWLLWIHIGASTLGAVLLIIEYARTARTPVAIVIAMAVIAFPVFFRMKEARALKAAGTIQNPDLPPVDMFGEGGGPSGPFFPSSAVTTSGKTIPSTFFTSPEKTCKRCHEDIYKQWFSSAHHFSSFNNQWYRKSIEYMQDVIGTKPSKWCGGCHDHAVLFNGMMDTPIKQIIQSKEAQAGLTCTSCHAIVGIRSTMGQGDFVIEYPALHDLAASDNKLLQKLHDFLVFTDPEPHKKVFMKPFVRQDTAKFCSSCHKVHLDVPVNNYRWFRGFNEYDNWQASGVSGQGARSFYYPPKPMKCADCHMPLVDAPRDVAAFGDGKVHSHRFPGANTALPFVNRDEEQFRVIEEFLKNDQVSVDIFAYVPFDTPGGRASLPATVSGQTIATRTGEGPLAASMFATGEEVFATGTKEALIRPAGEVIGPIDKIEAPVRRGETIRVEVVVRTRKVGHFFPGGTVDAFDVWLELQAVDNNGKTIFWSGNLENTYGPVEPGAHFYRSLLLDEHGNRINKRNAWAARSVAYVRLIPPGAADTAHFRMTIPPDCGDTITLKAKLNYRKFAWWNTNWAFAGIRDPLHKDFGLAPAYDDGRWIFAGDTSTVSGALKAIPNLPIIAMATDEKKIKVGDRQRLTKLKLDAADRERWNDYGIGLLLQGDLKGAEQAFLQVTRIDPKYADGWVNIGRARIQEGDTAGAQEVLKRALSLDPKLAKTHFFFGMTLKTQGQYDEALKHLQTASAQYPLDRVVRNQIGRILFLQRKYEQAVHEFRQTLQIDPEDLTAHYNLMLCYQGLGNAELAEKEQQLYFRFKADEASQTITGPFRQLNPEDNNERQSIHEHVSSF